MALEHDSADSFEVTKIDAARRQIDTAIDLWFHEGEPVSIHTLTAAARRIVLDLSVHRNVHLGLFDTSIVQKGKEQEYKRLLRQAETFFKHAKDDPDATMKFCPAGTEAYLLDALASFHNLYGGSTFLMMAFRFRFFLFNPHIFPNDLAPMIEEAERVKLRAMPKERFLRVFPEVIKILIECGHAAPL